MRARERNRRSTIVGFATVVSASLTTAGAALAQPPPEAPAPPAAPAPDLTTPIPVPSDLMKAQPDGVTSEQVGARAAQTSYQAKAAEEQLRAAAARVDQAWTNFLPRLTATARYTRLSSFTPPSLVSTGGGSLVGTPQPPGTLNPTPTAAVGLDFSFPLVLNQYLLQAQVVVPISDYFLRINQGYTAATHAQDAARFDAQSVRAKAQSDGRVAYFTWMRARGAVVVATQALNDQKLHLKDAQNQFTVGHASKADVLRAEAGVAGAELSVERARNLADLAEKQVRIAMHLPDEQRLVPGESVDATPAPVQGNLRQLIAEAHSNRLEIKSIDANAEAVRQQVRIANAGQLPQVSAFAEASYANPNQRRFPQKEEWFPTWSAGAQLTWSPNDVIGGGAAASEARARVAAIEAQRQAVRDGIELEVTQAWQAVKESDVAQETTRRALAAATEAYRVARELFNAGRITSVTVTDVETELTRTRLDALNAAVGARTARVQLDHALGRDTRAAR